MKYTAAYSLSLTFLSPPFYHFLPFTSFLLHSSTTFPPPPSFHVHPFFLLSFLLHSPTTASLLPTSYLPFTPAGIPHPRVNLRHGLLLDKSVNRTCLAGAGTLLLEFGMLSRLLDDPTFEGVAHRAMMALWERRSPKTGLLGNEIDIQSGEWVNKLSGLGAGMDSFYEYLLKAYIFLGRDEYLDMFMQVYHSIHRHMRHTSPPLYVNVDMDTGDKINNWIDSLQASFAGVQVLLGDLPNAIHSHMTFFSLWQRYGALPERYNWQLKAPDVHFYPLRPELPESTYLLYRATRDPAFFEAGEAMLNDLSSHARSMCGFATLHNVETKMQEDRMESFFLSETCKYLYLLFDEDNALHQSNTTFVFTTQAHLFPIVRRMKLGSVIRGWKGGDSNLGEQGRRRHAVGPPTCQVAVEARQDCPCKDGNCGDHRACANDPNCCFDNSVDPARHPWCFDKTGLPGPLPVAGRRRRRRHAEPLAHSCRIEPTPFYQPPLSRHTEQVLRKALQT